MPYIQYGLFKGYIAKNLCVKRNEKHNCCQGKCFLKKQIKQAGENENANNNSNKNSNKRIPTLEVNEFLNANIAVLASIETTQLLFYGSETINISQYVSDIFVPPQLLA